jgi:hypothetical protein
MFTMPIFPRYKEEKRTIITSITQYVMFRIMIPGSNAVGFSALLNGVFKTGDIIVKHEERYLPEETHGILLPSVVTGENCLPLCGDELYDNAEEQNREEFNYFVNHVIGEYKKKNNVIGNIDYKIEKYELELERKYERREETYMVPMMK